MALYDIGDGVTITAVFTVAGVNTDPTAVTLTIKSPAGTLTTPTPAHPATGTYTSVLSLTQSGTYWYRFVGTGTAAGAQEGFIDVAVSNVI